MKRLEIKALVSTLVLTLCITAVNAQPGGGRERMTPETMAEQRTESLDKSLSLSDDQKTAVYDIYLSSAQEMQTQMEGGERPDRESMMAAQQAQNEAIEKLLTDSQKEKYAEYLETQKSQQRQGGGQGGPQGRR